MSTPVANTVDVTAARRIAGQVPDPELPMVTIGDLGILRAVTVDERRRLVVSLTPTYSGCPAMAEIFADVVGRLRRAGFAGVTVRTVLQPAWSSDWITAGGARKLRAAGIAPPARVTRHPAGQPIPLTLGLRRAAQCPRCGSTDTTVVSNFGATSCTALDRCRACLEPLEHVKEI